MSDRHQVVVIGGGITGLSCAHRLLKRGADVLLLEAGPVVGGKIHTVRRGGYQFEAGPNTLQTGKPGLTELIAELGMEGEVVEAAPGARRRFISTPSGLVALPISPGAMVRSPLLGIGGVLAALGDLWRKRPEKTPEDESIADFVRRRLGTRVLENFVAPFLSGVYAGDPERLEAASVLPMLAQAEREHGSVIRGMIAARKAARAAGTAPGRSITFRDGLGALAAGLERSLGDRVRAECAVSWMEPYAGGVCLGLEDGSVVRCERAVVATPARAAAALLQGFDGGEDVAAVLSRVPLAGLAVVGLGYDRAAIRHPLDGFGYLAAHGTGAPVLGCMFRSALFPQAAPEGKALLTVFIGGAMHPGAVDLDDAALVRLARRELAVRLGAGEPEEVFVKRWQRAIPQYERGHARLAAAVREWSARNAVSVIGNGVTGLSLPECIGAGRAEADRLMGVIGGSIGSGRRADACVPA